ncbi:hypothetical protein AMTRI_Chr06g198490 [Amborella trichopoda]
MDLLVQVRLWDLAVALLGLFIFSGAPNALRQSGGTFSFRGVSPGRLYGVVTADPANLEYILKSKFKKFPKGKYYRERFSDFLGDGILMQMMMFGRNSFSFKTIEHLVRNKLIRLTEKLAVSLEMVDLQDVSCRLHSITYAWPHLGAFEQATELTLFRFLVPPFVWKPMKYFDVGTERRLREVIKVVHKFAEKTVSDRRFECQKSGGVLDRSDLLTRLIQVRNDDNSPCYSDKFLKDFCISFSRILDEIQAITKKRNNLGPEHLNNVIFTPDELKKMEFLQAALSESLRLYPSVPIDFREVLEDDILPNGRPVKKCAKIIYSVFSMARIESIWGKDCWPRLCVGKKFAYTQMKLVADSILLRYSVHVVKGHPVVPKLTTTLYMKHGLLVTFHPRVSTFP